jgi:hypothetical protein
MFLLKYKIANEDKVVSDLFLGEQLILSIIYIKNYLYPECYKENNDPQRWTLWVCYVT